MLTPSRPKILYCTTHFLHGHSYGGQLRALHVARLLQRHGDLSVALFPLEPTDGEAVVRTRREFDVSAIMRFQHRPISGMRERLSYELDPYCTNTHRSRLDARSATIINELVAAHDLVWFHGLRIPNSLDRAVWHKSVLDIDNVASRYHQSALRLARSPQAALIALRQWLLWRRREQVLRRRFTGIAVCSDADRKYLGDSDQIRTIPNGFELPALSLPHAPVSPARLGFIGKLEYPPNEDGVRWFVRNVWPMIRAVQPEARLRLVGAGSERIAAAEGANIDRLGWVADPASEMAGWSCMIVPIRIGAGTRIKIAEAFSRRCPVVATRLGAFGYDVEHGRELLLADAPRAFAAACLALMSNRDLAEGLAERGWDRFRLEWSWPAIDSKVTALLNQSLDRAQAERLQSVAAQVHGPGKLVDGAPRPQREGVSSNSYPPVPMHVHFVPRWPTNPYHAELARHLALFHVAVGEESRLKEIVLDARRTGHRPQIIHLHALPRFSLQPLSFARLVAFWIRLRRMQRSGVKIVWTVHDMAHHESIHPRVDRFFSRWLYRCADALIVHTAGARRTVETEWKVRRRANVSVVRHGHFIDCYPAAISREAARAKLGVPRDALTLLFFGYIRPYKGVVQLVEEFKAIANDHVRLVIAGQTLTAQLQREIEQSIGGSPQIIFHPRFVADDEVQNYMNCADAVVFPYVRALTSGALILAMSFGKACIAPKLGALADTLDERGGIAYDPDVPDALHRALAEALRRQAEFPDMGRHNRVRAESWNWTDTARATFDVYCACLAGPDASPRPSSTTSTTTSEPAKPIPLAARQGSLERAVAAATDSPPDRG